MPVYCGAFALSIFLSMLFCRNRRSSSNNLLLWLPVLPILLVSVFRYGIGTDYLWVYDYGYQSVLHGRSWNYSRFEPGYLAINFLVGFFHGSSFWVFAIMALIFHYFMYGIRYTGVMIENYEDAVNQTEPARQPDTTQFRYFGGMLLQMGGELGFHGYNHQPLALWDTDYGTLYVYKTWKNKETLVASLNELIAFQDEVLPNAHGSVYVPPSNILSARARKLIGTDVPRIKTIASTYFEDGTDLPYVQEFGVASDGIVEQPRIVSGGMVDDSYMRLAAVSELNMHYVSTHFMHPDDLLDPDRGAKEGWEVYKGGLVDYLEWLTKFAPDLRHQTASECSGAIQRFSSVTVSVDTSADAWTLSLGNFHDEVWLMFRANNGEPGAVTGGELTHLTGNLYLLKANDKTVTIERKEGGDK